AVVAHLKATGYPPKVILVRGVGLFAVGADHAQADTARLLYLNAIEVMAGALRLAKIAPLTDAQRRFIEEWEVESYRKSVAAAGAKALGRVAGKVALVTGAAQGFGLELAQAFVAEGGSVVLA